MQIPFVGGAYLARSTNLNAQQCVNLYAEKDESGTGKNVAALIGTPGLRRKVTLAGTGPVRGVWAPTFGDMIAVRGSTVYRVTSAWAATAIGTLSTATGRVSIADNGEVAVLVDGPAGYVIGLASSSFDKITDPDFYGADNVFCLDGYFVFNRPGTQQFYISSLGGTDFDALDFASAEGAPDLITTQVADHRQALFFGTESLEFYENTGAADFPFQRSGNVFIEQGCPSKFGATKIDNSVFWVGANKNGQGSIWRLDGATPRRISTHAIEFAIQGYSRIDDCLALSYQQEGHSFVVFIFPTGNATWVFDASTGLWHERAYLNPVTGTRGRHRMNCICFFAGQHIVGDFEDGRLYALDLDYFSDDGDPLPAIRAAAHIADADYKSIRFNALQIDFEAGVGLTTGQGSDPQAMLEWSNNGGKTWQPAVWADIGAIGDYGVFAQWRKLGRTQRGGSRIYRVTITDPVKRVIIGASSEAAGTT